MSKYTDVQTLRRTGYWPNKEIPQWVIDRSLELDCASCNGAVLESAYEDEIQTLRDEIQTLRQDRTNVRYDELTAERQSRGESCKS